MGEEGWEITEREGEGEFAPIFAYAMVLSPNSCNG